MPKIPPTPKEREELLTRIAVARCLVKRGRMPTEDGVKAELAAMVMPAAMGREIVEPAFTAADATAWLASQGLTVPEKDQ